MTDDARALIAAIRSRGSNARNLRDAAHEACHALECEVPEGDWDRETIHGAILELGRSDVVRSELLARGVETIVCDRLGQPLKDPEEWVLVAAMEMIKTGISMPYQVWEEGIALSRQSPEAARMAERILGLRSL